ncbi:MAG TPA: acyl-CoA dehydrogenase family protein [Caulobacteraceae bacterium]|jgi:alkylation response protein AidB-like acyl-CoA dehydrogenase|nr:acyl-CoA dehydrogenase family protein [Caulobacteraceae bacterium]
MDMDLNETQSVIHDACSKLLARRAGPARARELRKTDDFDRLLMIEMDEAGFLDLFYEPDAGPLAGALITEWAASAAALAPIGARVLVAPSVMGDRLPLVIAIADRTNLAAVRFAAEADLLILVDGDEASVAGRGAFEATSVRTKFGFPMARVENVQGTPLLASAGATVKRWWRVSLAAEIAGAARSAVDLTIRYLQDRVQFDRPIASYQAIQHRLVECHVLADAAQWSMREAAFHGAPAELAAGAAVTACEAAHRLFYELHQLSGAIGFTSEYDLHLFTMRLQALRIEMNGVRGHARALVEARWPAAG